MLFLFLSPHPHPISSQFYPILNTESFRNHSTCKLSSCALVVQEKILNCNLRYCLHLCEEFPFEPPQVRILQPRLVCPIVFHGALCLEVLSVFGWSPSMSIDMVLHHIIDQLVIQKPKVKRGSYTEIEAANVRQYINKVHEKGY